MCGIAGVFGIDLDQKIKNDVIKLLHHRGPDSQGSYQDKEVWIAHTRLAIIDLSSKSSQPMTSRCGRWKLVFNGEIYNYIELRGQLINEGVEFSTTSDTEVFLYGLIKYGSDFQLKCNGMWAFCLWDSEKCRALLGRDRFGKKPLFYAQKKGVFVFASEMKAVARVIGKFCPSELSKTVFSYSNIFQYEFLKKTVIKDIKKILPGHCLQYQKGTVKEDRWWCTLDHLVEVPIKYDDQVREFRKIFIDAVRIRMRSDVPIGTALSGGLDSSSIVATMNFIKKQDDINQDVSSDWQHCFCSFYENSSLDESKWAGRVCDSLGLKLDLIDIKPNKSNWSIKEAFNQVEDPYITLPIPHLELYRAISNKGIKVSIDGHGADELFSGYDELLAAAPDATFSQISELVAIHRSTQTGVYHLNLFDAAIQYCKYLVKRTLSPIYNRIRGVKKVDFVDRHHPEYLKMDNLTKNLYELFHITILPTLLRNYDRYSMASGVEVRMPFMDHRVVCFLFSLPWSSKVGSGYTKRLLRDAMKGILIDDVRKRRDKIGWNAPIHEWLRDDYLSELNQYLKSGIFENNVEKKINRFSLLKSPKFMDGQRLWKSILPDLWKSSVLDKDCN